MYKKNYFLLTISSFSKLFKTDKKNFLFICPIGEISLEIIKNIFKNFNFLNLIYFLIII